MLDFWYKSKKKRVDRFEAQFFDKVQVQLKDIKKESRWRYLSLQACGTAK